MNTVAVFRVEKNHNYTVMSNYQGVQPETGDEQGVDEQPERQMCIRDRLLSV